MQGFDDKNNTDKVSSVSLDEFKVRYKPYKFDTYQEFVTEKNIFNNDILNEQNLNRAVNELKRENLVLWSIIQILQNKTINKWHPKEVYERGEFVFWPGYEWEKEKLREYRKKLEDAVDETGKKKYSDAQIDMMMIDIKDENLFSIDEINKCYYVAIHSDFIEDVDGTKVNINKGKDPLKYSQYWLPVNKTLLLPDFSTDGCVKFRAEDNLLYSDNWRCTEPDDAANIRYVDAEIAALKGDVLKNFVEKNNKVNLDPYFNHRNSVVTKHYLDEMDNDYKTGRRQARVSQYLWYNGKELAPSRIVLAEGANRKLTQNNDSISYMSTPSYGLLPGQENVSTIGTPSNKFKAMYAEDFIGIALKARYADLAEFYDADKDYEPGTVLGVGGEREVTIYNPMLTYAGVVTENPALIMNNENNFDFPACIALKGRIRVKVKGKVKKGDFIIAHLDGYARASEVKPVDLYNVIGVSLEDKNQDEIKLVLVKI